MKYAAVAFGAMFLLSHCTNTPNEKLQYFGRGELSKEVDADSTAINFYSKLLYEMNEPPLRATQDSVDAFRLIVRDPIYNPFIIHVRHRDSLTSVTFKVAPDKPGRERSGLSNLTLTYESSSKRMDSLYQILNKRIKKYEFYNAFDDPKDYVIADGTPYLLESLYNGEYHVVRGVGVGVGKGPPFRGSDDFFSIVQSLHMFIPREILPDLDKTRTIEDMIFPVLRRDTISD